jgi:predicted DNA-binding protein (UPF0251 family)
LRRVAAIPAATIFKFQVRPRCDLGEAVLTVEGLEALRLADLEGQTAEAAAADMAVSRHTFGRVLAEARQTVAQALVRGMDLRIAGGNYRLAGDGPVTISKTNTRPLCDGAAPAGAAQEDQMKRGQGQCGRGSGQGQGSGQGRGQGQGANQGNGQGRGQGQGRCGQGRGLGQGGQGVASGSQSVASGSQSDPASGGLPVAAVPKALGPAGVCPACGAAVSSGESCPACGAALVRN